MSDDDRKINLPPGPDALDCKWWELTIDHHFDEAQMEHLGTALSLDDLTFETSITLELDAESYAKIAPEPEVYYTIEHTVDLNPWHRETTGWRAALRRWRDVARWEFRRRVLRRDVTSTVTMTIPNCKVVSE